MAKTEWVGGVGPIPCRLVIVGEAPGKEEVRQGEPFVGKTGKEMNNLLRRFVGIEKEDAYCTNIFKYPLQKKGGGKDYTQGEFEWMKAVLEEEVGKVDPEIILALGAISKEAFLGDRYDMETLNALPHKVVVGGKERTVIPSFHPAAGFRDGAVYQWVEEAFGKVKEALNGRMEYVKEHKPVEVWGGQAYIGDVVAVDTETLRDGSPYMVTWSYKPGQACYAYVGYREMENVRDWLNKDITTLLHNALFDLPVLRKAGIVPRRWIDTMQVAFLLQTLPMGLKNLAYKLCGIRMKEYDELMKEYGAKDLSEVPEKERIAYACQDADATLRVYNEMRKRYYPRMEEVLQRDLDIQPMLIAMMQRGFRTSIEVLHNLDEEMTNLNMETWCEIEYEVGKTIDKVDIDTCPEDEKRIVNNIRKNGFNPASAKQLSYFLYDKMHVGEGTKIRKSRWGKTTESKALKRMSGENNIIPKIIQWKERDTLIDKSLRQLPKYIRRDGKIHTKLSMIRVKHSGRLASSSPNLMAQPNRTDEYLKIRKAFMAEEGYTLLSYDFSGIEMRVLAHLSQDDGMLAVYRDPKGDIHTANHISIFGRPDKTHEERVMIKRTGFGIAYLISGRGLSELLLPLDPRFTEFVCQEYIDTWFKKHPGVADYVQKTFAEARRYERVVDMFGRMEYIPEVRSCYPEIREAGLRKAVNMKIQGSAQGIIKEAMRQMWGTVEEWRGDGLVYPILQVHDDLIFEVREDFVQTALPAIRDVMERCVELSIPIKVDVKIGEVWGKMEKWREK